MAYTGNSTDWNYGLCSFCKQKPAIMWYILDNTLDKVCCADCLDKQYLLQDLQNVSYAISKDRILIEGFDHDYFFCECFSKYTKKEIFGYYSEIVQLCKQLGVKIQYTEHYKKRVLELWQDYGSYYEKSRVAFAKIVEQAYVVQKRGIHKECRFDRELDKLRALKEKYRYYLQYEKPYGMLIIIVNNLIALRSQLLTAQEGRSAIPVEICL